MLTQKKNNKPEFNCCQIVAKLLKCRIFQYKMIMKTLLSFISCKIKRIKGKNDIVLGNFGDIRRSVTKISHGKSRKKIYEICHTVYPYFILGMPNCFPPEINIFLINSYRGIFIRMNQLKNDQRSRRFIEFLLS
jgi:hypothetical protein